MDAQKKGRITFIGLVVLFALPAIAAKVILTQNWYQSGVTNKGELIEPSVSYSSLGLINPFDKQKWQLGYVVPETCDEFCQQQVHLLQQSHIALGKYQGRVEPVLIKTANHSPRLTQLGLAQIEVNEEFSKVVSEFEFVIVDPLGQLVMRYPKASETELVAQSKGLLADLRKLLKLSRVG